MKDTIVITGATGFIGMHLVHRLAKQYSIIALVRNTKKFFNLYKSAAVHEINAQEINVIEADLAYLKSLELANRDIKGPCYLVHLGGSILGDSSNIKCYDARVSIESNITGSYNLIVALKAKLTGVCLASTLDVYGKPQYLPIDEKHPTLPKTFYAASKLAMEYYGQIELQGCIPLAILRFTHVYGQGDGHKKALKIFIDCVLGGENPVIYGDGKDLRDYIHVDDAVEVISRTIDSRKTGLFNVASGHSISLKEMAEIVIKTADKKLTPVYKERKRPQVDYVFNTEKLNKEFNFYPRISFADGVRELILYEGKKRCSIL